MIMLVGYFREEIGKRMEILVENPLLAQIVEVIDHEAVSQGMAEADQTQGENGK